MKRRTKSDLLVTSWSIYPVCLTFIVTMCSCIANNDRYYPVTNLKARESSLGFSISPPTGLSWYEKHNAASLYYLKKTSDQKCSIFTKATEIHWPEGKKITNSFVQFVKSKKALNMSAGDYRNINFRYTKSVLSPFCIRYFQDYEDHSIKKLNMDDFIVVKNSGLVCMHPDTPGDGVDMYYQESFLRSGHKQKKSYVNEGETFLSSLRFFTSDGGSQ